MDFTLSEAHRELCALTRGILTDRVTADRLREIEAKDEPFDRALWTELATAGVLAAALPPETGGDGYGLLEQCGVLIEIGRAVAPVPYLSSIVTAAAGLARFGDADQVARWAVPAGRAGSMNTVIATGISRRHVRLSITFIARMSPSGFIIGCPSFQTMSAAGFDASYCAGT